MIQEALTYISKKINIDFFTLSGTPRVILGNVAALSDAGNTEPNVILSLINIEEEVLLRNPETFLRTPAPVYRNPPIYLNVTVIFGAYQPNKNDSGQNYEESISKIQKVIGFFQRRNVFDKSEFNDLPDGIENLRISLVNLSLDQLHQLWSILGGKYVPSVVYKMRMVIIDEAIEGPEVPLITQIVIDDKIKFQQ